MGVVLILISLIAAAQAEVITACGEITNSSSARIVGGETAKPHEIPWQVAIVRSKSPVFGIQCGGTILCPNFVLSAAHCTRDRFDPENSHMAEDWDILAGEHDWTVENDGETRHRVESITPHPFYTDDIDYDFIIMKLKDRIVLNGWSKVAACLPTPEDNDFDEGTEFVTSGWGTIDYFQSGNQPAQLKRASVKLCSANDAHCNKCPLREVNLCVKSNEGVGVCSGDSGGPLTWVDPLTSKVKVVGVAMRVGSVLMCGAVETPSCASQYPDQTPTVYARVSTVLSWIKAITGECQDKFA